MKKAGVTAAKSSETQASEPKAKGVEQGDGIRKRQR